MRSGCSSVGGKTSRMPPRTANSPRFSTSSTREYAAAARPSTISFRSALWPLRSATGSRSPRPLTCGWSTERIGATTTLTGPSGRVVVARVREAAQYGEAAADGVGAGREPLVRQGLPGGVLGDRVGVEERAERGGQVLGLPPGRRDGQDRAPRVTGERGDGERPRGGGPDQVDVRAVPVGGGLHRLGEGRVLDDYIKQAVQAHGAFHPGFGVRGAVARGRTTRTARHVERAGVPSVRRGNDSRFRNTGRRRGAAPAYTPFGGPPGPLGYTYRYSLAIAFRTFIRPTRRPGRGPRRGPRRPSRRTP